MAMPSPSIRPEKTGSGTSSSAMAHPAIGARTRSDASGGATAATSCLGFTAVALITFCLSLGVVKIRVNCAELLQRLHASKPLHRPFLSSERLMRILRSIVEPTADLLTIGVADLIHCRRISAKPVGDDAARPTVFLHDPLEQAQRRSLVPL